MADIIQLNEMRRFYDSGATKPYAFRLGQLKKFKDCIVRNEKAIFDALYADLRKIPEECWFTENGLLVQEINHAIRHLKEWMRPQKTATNLVNLPSKSFLFPSPRGVVLIIGPWNFPLQLLLIPLAGAIAAGNCVMVKPSEFAPATADIIEKIITETFSKDHVGIAQGEGAEVVPAMMSGFRFDHVFYTGSIPVGKMVCQMAAKDLIPVTLELGGKDPCVVEADADLKVAARRIALGKFTNAGQMCVSPDYLLVQEEVKNKLLDQIREATRRFYGEDPSATYGYNKIINEKRFDRLVSYLSQGKIVFGGQHDRSKLFIAPTLLENVAIDAPVMQEEIFGPILPVFGFKEKEEAMAIIRHNPNPLSFYLFTADRKKEKEWMEKIQFGTAGINTTALQFTNHHLPFGGIGQSGMGSYHGKHTFDVFTHYKAVMRTPTWFDPALKYPPMKGKLKLLKFLLK